MPAFEDIGNINNKAPIRIMAKKPQRITWKEVNFNSFIPHSLWLKVKIDKYYVKQYRLDKKIGKIKIKYLTYI